MNTAADTAAFDPNFSASSGSLNGGDKVGGFGYGIAISVGIVVLITTITLASYFCTRVNTTGRHQRRAASTVAEEEGDVEAGIDEATLRRYPKATYEEAKLQGRSTTGACCSICLADYKDGHVLRLLPECHHAFHLECIDPWLRQHPTCPVCRTSPVPSLLPTPLAEVVPLRQT